MIVIDSDSLWPVFFFQKSFKENLLILLRCLPHEVAGLRLKETKMIIKLSKIEEILGY